MLYKLLHYILTKFVHFPWLCTDCLKPEFSIYGLHHALTILASYRMINQRNWNETMFASSCWLVELSTPFLNHYQVNGGMKSAIAFAISFFLFRVLWLSKLSIQGWSTAVNRLEFVVIIVFTALNYYWFLDIVRAGVKLTREATKKDETNVSKATSK